MATKQTLYTEQTSGVFKFLPRRLVAVEDQFGDSEDYRCTVQAPRGWTLTQVEEALRDALNSHCQHSYDCCGHWYGYVRDVRHTKRRNYTFIYYTYQNV